MPERSERFDADLVRSEWDTAADAYAEGQATGRDYYRLEFFGPAQVALCGEVQGLRLLDGNMPLSKINSLQIDLYKQQRLAEPAKRGGVRRGKSSTIQASAKLAQLTRPATINRELAVMSHLLSQATEWGWIKARPVKMRRFQEQRTRFDYFTEKEISQLLSAAAADQNPQIYSFVYIALHTAMRASEDSFDAPRTCRP